MKLILKFILFGCLVLSCFSIANFALAINTEIHFFYLPGCAFCKAEESFLDELENNYEEIEIFRYNTLEKDNIELLRDFHEKYDVPKQKRGLVPATFTEQNYFIGFDESIAKQLENCIESCILATSTDIVSGNEINVPFIGMVDPSEYSLGFLAVMLGFFDGFNVCSLGALVIILGLVMALKSRAKIFYLGLLFILTTGIIYGALIFLWYSIFSFLTPVLNEIELIVGTISLIGAYYFFKEFLRVKKQGVVCKVENSQGRLNKLSARLQNALKKHSTQKIALFSLLIIVFAFFVTILEFPCSAALPVIFAGVAASHNLSTASYFGYLAIYLLFYLVDEIIIFLLAVFTLKIRLGSGKISKYLALLEAIILASFGAYYLFNFFSAL